LEKGIERRRINARRGDLDVVIALNDVNLKLATGRSEESALLDTKLSVSSRRQRQFRFTAKKEEEDAPSQHPDRTAPSALP
jgi:hypothetical protein